MTVTFSVTRLQKYSLFQKYNARSATCIRCQYMPFSGIYCDDGTNLEMGAGHGLGELVKQRLLHLGELIRIHDLEDVLHLVQEHDLLRAVDLGPVA